MSHLSIVLEKLAKFLGGYVLARPVGRAGPVIKLDINYTLYTAQLL